MFQAAIGLATKPVPTKSNGRDSEDDGQPTDGEPLVLQMIPQLVPPSSSEGWWIGAAVIARAAAREVQSDRCAGAPMHTGTMHRPTSEEIAALPLYRALALDRIHVLRSDQQCESAGNELRNAGHIGFDTESKPQFVAGGEHSGPHIVQFATAERAFIVHTEAPGTAAFLKAMLESDAVVKVGFGLASDRMPLFRKLGVRLSGTVDVSRMVRRLGFKDDVGLKTAVAVVLNQRFPKSKKVTTSNWALNPLSAQQLQYAANDAHASLLVYQALLAMGLTDRAQRPAADRQQPRGRGISGDEGGAGGSQR